MEARPPEGPSSRYKILWAAATMLGGDSATTPSVRAVAVRAGVSAGSVQHHFPTQRELMDEVLILVYDTVLQAEGAAPSYRVLPHGPSEGGLARAGASCRDIAAPNRARSAANGCRLRAERATAF